MKKTLISVSCSMVLLASAGCSDGEITTVGSVDSPGLGAAGSAEAGSASGGSDAAAQAEASGGSPGAAGDPSGVGGAGPTRPPSTAAGGSDGAQGTQGSSESTGGVVIISIEPPESDPGNEAAFGTCEPGLYYYCSGEDGCLGQMACAGSGEDFEACKCLTAGKYAENEPWDAENGNFAAPAEIPLLDPAYVDDHLSDPFIEDTCPTRPDLVSGTACPELDQGCNYGGCAWDCSCEADGWHCGVRPC